MSDSTPILSTEAADETAGSATTCLEISLLEFAPAQRPLVEEVVEGLTADEKFLPAKLHYDQRGSELFEQICQLEEYYITRTELAIMRDNVVQVADQLGPGCLLIEPGSGASLKTRLLLEALDSPAGYVPVDISRDFLLESAAAIARRHDVEVLPVWADFTKPHPVPEPDADVEAKAVYFPGSTVGNFTRRQAEGLLGRFAAMVGGKGEAEGAEAGSVLVGFDQKKDVARMEAAYNDSEGVTAEFNYNVIDRLARELDVPLDREKFSFRADWDEQTGAIVSRLWAREAHEVVIAGRRVCFDEGEPICMEESHKYTPEEFEALAASVGLRTEQIWTDAAADFAVVHLRA